MANINLHFRVHIAWWFTRLYLPALKTMCTLMQCEPDMDRVEYWLNKAMRIERRY